MDKISILLTEREVAGILGVTPQCLHVWRRSGKGPRHIRVGRLIRYKPEDISAFIETHSARGREAAR
jgi:predicted DNA-binding transcriptional regulator AlpA